jgi:hypothetical protein
MTSCKSIPLIKAIAFLETHVLPSYDELFVNMFCHTITYIDASALFRDKVIRRVQKEKNLNSYCILVMICQRVFHQMTRELFNCL